MNSDGSGSSARTMNIVRLGLLVVTLASLFALPATAYHASAAQTVNVYMSDTSFLPKTITINVGDTVIWNNNGTVVHTTTSNNGQAESWDSGDMSPGQIASHTFTIAGNFSYSCVYHPDMVGNVVVQAPVPEFPGFLAFVTVGVAMMLGLIAERTLRGSR